MLDYTKSEARAWAREHFTGTCAVTHPSYSSDFEHINEKAIAHDVARVESFGFHSTLLVSDLAVTPEENARITEIARGVTKPEFGLFFHAAFRTLEENIVAATLAEKAGADRCLLAYPTTFWPTTEDEIFDYTVRFAEATNLAIMLFPIPQWGFERIHPAGMSSQLVRRILDACPNIVAIKAEQGFPGIAGLVECHQKFGEEVIISAPIEGDTIPLLSLIDFQFSGTSNTNWMSDYFPKTFEMARRGEWDAVWERYWQVQPARLANMAIGGASMPGTSVINRTAWKYQEWLAGFNGGALRPPAARIPDRLMKQARQALIASGLPVTDTPDEEFIRGRFPV